MEVTEDPGPKVSFMTLDPGHFHAALVYKSMYNEVDSTIYIYAPEGPEIKDFLNKISGYNNRNETPTKWKISSYLGPEYMTNMLREKPGNVLVIAGKNSKKIDYVFGSSGSRIECICG